ncbi:MAG: DNA gyrase inhibitor YacG [Gammaproteobacteria bacterium]|nr:DNA gyrase inhibitor YacG [Gammaproteobacteria bacterium]
MTEGTPRIVACPNCGKAAKWTIQNPSRPFCSERCKLIDLGDWASEGHVIPGSEVDEFMGSELEGPKPDLAG